MTQDSTALHQLRVRFATFRERPADERTAYAQSLARAEAPERVLLDTCHRVELVTVEQASVAEDGLEGRDAVRRVFEVVAGFDSAVMAEEQLLGQARTAYETALAAGSTGPILNELFRRALRFGRRVRSHATPGSERSLADRGAAWLLERLTGTRADVVVAGTGEMAGRVAMRVAEAGHPVTVVSHAAERATRLVHRLPGSGHRALDGPLPAQRAASADAIALAVRRREPVLTRDHLHPPMPWVLDLSVPPAVSPDAAVDLGDALLGIDRLGRLAGSAPVLAPSVERRLRAELEAEVDRFAAWVEARRSGDALAVLHREAEAVRRRHLDRLRRRARLAPAQIEAVEAASAAMVGELLHGPSIELRRGGADAAVVRRLFGLDR